MSGDHLVQVRRAGEDRWHHGHALVRGRVEFAERTDAVSAMRAYLMRDPRLSMGQWEARVVSPPEPPASEPEKPKEPMPEYRVTECGVDPEVVVEEVCALCESNLVPAPGGYHADCAEGLTEEELAQLLGVDK